MNNDYGKKDHGGAMHPPRYPVELYDLKNDPGETQNIAEQFPQVVDRLFVKLKHATLKKGIHFWAPRSQSKEVSRKTLERLKSLGYVQ